MDLRTVSFILSQKARESMALAEAVVLAFSVRGLFGDRARAGVEPGVEFSVLAPQDASGRRAPRWRRGGVVLVLLALTVLPVWSVAFPPLVDYPNHLARAYILAHLSNPRLGLGKYYASNWGLYPYLTQDLCLIVLQRFFSIYVSGKIFLSLCLLLLPVSVWSLLRVANPGGEDNAVWILPFAFSSFFLSGFADYYLSVALCLFTVAAFVRAVERPAAGRSLAVLALAVLTYFTHIIGFAAAGLIAGLYLLSRRPFNWRGLAQLLPFAPGIALYEIWRSRAGGAGMHFIVPSGAEKLVGILEATRGYSRPLDMATVCVIGFAFLLAWRLGAIKFSRRWVPVFLAVFAVDVAMPDIVGTFLYLRFAPLLLVLPLACFRVVSWRRAAFLLAFGLFLLRTGDVLYRFRRFQPELVSLAEAARAIPPHSRVLPIVESHGEPLDQRAYVHFWAYGVIQGGWFSPYLFHARGIQPQPLRIVPRSYAPKGFGWGHYKKAPNWGLVQSEYDYVWAYNVKSFVPGLEAIGTEVFARRGLVVFRLTAARHFGGCRKLVSRSATPSFDRARGAAERPLVKLHGVCHPSVQGKEGLSPFSSRRPHRCALRR